MAKNCTIKENLRNSFCHYEKLLRKEKPCSHGNIIQTCIMTKDFSENHTVEDCYDTFSSMCIIPLRYWELNMQSVCMLPFLPTYEMCYCENVLHKNKSDNELYECECMHLPKYHPKVSTKKHPNAKNCTCNCEDIYKKKCNLYGTSDRYRFHNVTCHILPEPINLDIKIDCEEKGTKVRRKQSIEPCNITKYLPKINHTIYNITYLNVSSKPHINNLTWNIHKISNNNTVSPMNLIAVTHSPFDKSESTKEPTHSNKLHTKISSTSDLSKTKNEYSIPSANTTILTEISEYNALQLNHSISENASFQHMKTEYSVTSSVTIVLAIAVILGISFSIFRLGKKTKKGHSNKHVEYSRATNTENERLRNQALFKSRRSKGYDDLLELDDSDSEEL